MRQGFIFEHTRCVACGACRAACILENGWTFSPRMIYTANKEALPGIPVVHLSLACNHCNNAVCMDGCPAKAYHRDPDTGAVELDDSKCLGCRYCSWNCPYDAPKYLVSEKVIGKCNLCHQRLAERLTPACSSACPTGALNYGEIDGLSYDSVIKWFADKNLEPAIRLTGIEGRSPEVIPEGIYETEPVNVKPDDKSYAEEWSLIAFSLASTFSVSYLASTLLNGRFPEMITTFLLLLLPAVLSMFHLGKKTRAWRSLSYLGKSPLSREILLFILYSLASLTGVVLQLPWLLISSSVSGLMLLLAIDSVYFYSDNRRRVIFHSGQTFISALLIVSFMTGRIFPFVFIAILKLAASASIILKEKNRSAVFEIRFLRIALLFIAGVSILSGISYPGIPVTVIFFAGELIDRILFYYDFKPLNINNILTKDFSPDSR
jgi:Fe-S-cluster-containing dehydrogenase component/DMSO reductase anchor subunit